MTVKEKVIEVISRMPDDSTIDDIGYELCVIESVQKGLDELDRGDYLTHEQAKEKLNMAASPEKSRFGCMRDSLEIVGDIVEPLPERDGENPSSEGSLPKS